MATVSGPPSVHASPRVTMRQRAPFERKSSANFDPVPPLSANTTQDFSSGDPSMVAAVLAGAASSLRANSTICASPPCALRNPGKLAVSTNPASRSTCSHRSRDKSGCSGRRSWSVMLHHPLVSPKIDSVQSRALPMSMKASVPPGASRRCRRRRVLRTSAAAWRTLVPTMKSNVPSSISWSSGSRSRSSARYSTSGKAASFCCAGGKKPVETSVKT